MGSGHRLTCIALALVALAPAVEASPPTAWLSWDRESRVTDLNDVPGYRVSLFMRIADPPSGFIALASQLRWTPNDLLGPCYGLWSDSLSGSPDGYWEFEPGGLSLGSDSTFHYSLHPPAGGDLLFKYQFGGGACGARPATVCLDWVKFVTAAGDTVFADVLGGATVLGGDGDCGLFLQQLSPAILGQRAAVSVEIVGGGFSAGMMASLEGNAGARAADSFLVITSSRVHAVFDTRGFSGAARVVLTTPDGASASSSALVEASSSTPAPYDSASLILWTRPGRLLLPSASTGAALPAVSGDLGFAASLALLGVSRVESCSPASILDPELAATLASPAQLDIFILHLADTNVVETCQQLASDTTNVIECHPNWTGLFMEVVPSDALMPKSWHLRNTGAFPEPGNTRPGWDSRVSRAWSISSGGVPVRVGVLDSGSRTGHPDLVGRYANGPIPPDLGITDATDYLGHGAPVAGIIGATGGAGRAVGVDWSAEIYSFKISNNNHSINEGVVNQALDYARWYACRMVNMSFGAMPPSGTMEEHLYNAFHAGIFLAAASGNYDSYFRSWPAEYHPYVVSVGASLYDGRRWSDGNIGWEPSWGYTDSVPSLGSSWGNHLKFLAPGGRFIPTTAGPAGYADPDPARLFLPHHQDVPSTVASGSPYWGFGGTSAATPVVSGAAALIRSIAGDSLGNEEIAHLLSMTARPPFEGPSGYQPQSGWGVVDIEAALGAVRPGMRIERAVAFGGHRYGHGDRSDSGSNGLPRPPGVPTRVQILRLQHPPHCCVRGAIPHSSAGSQADTRQRWCAEHPGPDLRFTACLHLLQQPESPTLGARLRHPGLVSGLLCSENPGLCPLQERSAILVALSARLREVRLHAGRHPPERPLRRQQRDARGGASPLDRADARTRNGVHGRDGGGRVSDQARDLRPAWPKVPLP